MDELKILMNESLWWLGFLLLVVLGFVFKQYFSVRKRKSMKKRITNEDRALWNEVQRKRGENLKRK